MDTDGSFYNKVPFLIQIFSFVSRKSVVNSYRLFKLINMKTLVPLIPHDSSALEDKKREISYINQEILELTSDTSRKPSHIMRKLKELQGVVRYCREEYNELAKNVRINYL